MRAQQCGAHGSLTCSNDGVLQRGAEEADRGVVQQLDREAHAELRALE
jgi:hypothetical protein